MKSTRYVCALFLAYCSVLSAVPSFRAANSVPSELIQPSSLGGIPVSGTLQQHVQFSELMLRDLAKKQVQAVLPGGRALFVDGMPQVPVTSRSIALPRGKSGVVVLENMKLEESTAQVSLPKTPEALVWEPTHKKMNFASPAYGRYFPGKFYSAKEANGVLHVSLFPVQYDLQSGKMLILRSADLRVELVEKMREVLVPNLWAPPAIILTTEALKPAAEVLQKFHADALKMKSAIVTVESIAASEKAIADEELPDGYKKGEDVEGVAHVYDPEKKKGYNYELAKKIISYLQKRMAEGSPTKYVTILGDAEAVPPSYYFAVGSGFSRKFGVTDQCYAAKKQCSEPKLAVGRLPLTSVDEVKAYLKKASQWLAYSQSASSELSLFGGKAFPTDVFIGELGTLKTLNTEKADWRGVKKFYRTRKNFNKETVLDLVRGNNPSSFIYYLDHGNGNQWYVERDYVSSKDVLEAKEGGSGTTPVVVSIACTNAAFDETLAKEEVLSGPTATDGAQSVGVSMIKSKAGAVVYLGSSRPALGVPVYNVDKNGNLSIEGTTYGLQMFDTFFDKYRDLQGGRLGDVIVKMFTAYQTENGNDMDNERNTWTYFNVALLGDPVLPLPQRKDAEKTYAFASSTTEFEAAQFGGFPRFLMKEGSALSLSLKSGSKVTATLMKMARGPFSSGEEVVEEKVLSDGAKMPVALEGDDAVGQYFLRLENAEGVPFERQVWFNVAKP